MDTSPTRSRTRLPALLVAATALAAASLVAPQPAEAVTGTVARMWDCSLYTGKCVRTNSGTGTSDSCRWAGRYIVVGPTPATIGCEAWRR
jgi:hypothetical protein